MVWVGIAANVLTTLGMITGVGLLVWKGGRFKGEIITRIDGIERALEMRAENGKALWDAMDTKQAMEQARQDQVDVLERLNSIDEYLRK